MRATSFLSINSTVVLQYNPRGQNDASRKDALYRRYLDESDVGSGEGESMPGNYIPVWGIITKEGFV